MAFFRFGVAYPLVNHKFRNPTQVSLTVDEITDGNTKIGLGTNSRELVEFLVDKNDRLIIGANSSGESENAVIKQIGFEGGNTAILTLRDALTNTFVNGNAVLVKGTKLAGSWTRSGASESQKVDTLRIRPFGGGAFDEYAQVMRWPNNALADLNGITQSLEKDTVEHFTYYRFGGQFRLDLDDNIGTGKGRVKLLLAVNDGSTQISSESLSVVDILTFAELTSSPIFFRKRQTSDGEIKIAFSADTVDRITTWIDELFLEHARGTTSISRIKSSSQSGAVWTLNIYDDADTLFIPGETVNVNNGTDFAELIILSRFGQSLICNFISGSNTSAVMAQDSEIQTKNNGYWELQDYWIRESADAVIINTGQTVRLGDNSANLFNPNADGDRSERYIFTCDFRSVSQAIWDNLQVLMRWQKRGSLIAFHPSLQGLPPVMIGKLSILGFNKATLFDLTKFDFTMRFEELSI